MEMPDDSSHAMKRMFEGRLPGWPVTDVLSWLLTQGRQIEPTSDLVGALCERLLEAGAPLIRVRISLLTLLPQVRDFSFTWQPGRTVALGHHDLPGIDTPQEAFTLGNRD